MSEPILLPQRLAPGTVIDGRYRVDSLLESGSMGAVYAGRHIQLDEPVALKFLSQPKAEQAGFRARFVREAKVTAKLRGRNIVRTSDFGVDKAGRPFLVMELLEGVSLRAKLAGLGRLPVPMAVDYAVQVCQGLAEAHRRGVVHRDLKPANLFIVDDVDGSELVKILDFGLSKLRFFAEEDLTAEGASLGSPKYMAPELVGSAETADERADVWSIGAVLYEMLAGRPPFRAPSTAQLIMRVASGEGIVPLSRLRPEVGPALEAAIVSCLTKARHLRTESVGVLAAQLAAAVPEAGLQDAAQQVVDILFKTERRVRQSPARKGEGSTGGSSRRLVHPADGDNREGTSKERRRPGSTVLTWAGAVALVGTIVALAWFAFGPTGTAGHGVPQTPAVASVPSELSPSMAARPHVSTAPSSKQTDPVEPGESAPPPRTKPIVPRKARAPSGADADSGRSDPLESRH